MKNTFISFLESMKSIKPALIEHAINGFNICFESETDTDSEYLLYIKYIFYTLERYLLKITNRVVLVIYQIIHVSSTYLFQCF